MNVTEGSFSFPVIQPIKISSAVISNDDKTSVI